MKRSPPLRLESLEDRCTPATLTVSFVPDGTQIGMEHSQLFRDMNTVAPTATWQQNIVNMLQSAAAPYNINLQLAPDDGATMNTYEPQDGQLRIAATDMAFQTNGLGMMIPGFGDLVVESQVTFGIGVNPIGQNGPPAQPPVNLPTPGTTAPNTPPTATLPFILPFPTSIGNLFPTSSPPSPINPLPPPPGSPPLPPLLP